MFENKKSKEEIILIKNIKELKHIVRDKAYNNYELVEPIMIKGTKHSKPEPNAPEWFTSWVKNQYEKTPPSWFTGWVKNQYEPDVKNINKRLDNVDQRLDKVEHRMDNVEHRIDNLEKRLNNIVHQNNLKE